jgi:hypothetical protein
MCVYVVCMYVVCMNSTRGGGAAERVSGWSRIDRNSLLVHTRDVYSSASSLHPLGLLAPSPLPPLSLCFLCFLCFFLHPALRTPAWSNLRRVVLFIGPSAFSAALASIKRLGEVNPPPLSSLANARNTTTSKSETELCKALPPTDLTLHIKVIPRINIRWCILGATLPSYKQA